MGTLAVRTRQLPGGTSLTHFSDKTLAQMRLDAGSWVIFGRVFIKNRDDEAQFATVRIRSQPTNPPATPPKELDVCKDYLESMDTVCYSLQATLLVTHTDVADIVTLEGLSYSADAQEGSMIAIAVEEIDDQSPH